MTIAIVAIQSGIANTILFGSQLIKTYRRGRTAARDRRRRSN
jgi:hypothetical protein